MNALIIPVQFRLEQNQRGEAAGLEDFRRADWIRIVPLKGKPASLVLIDERKTRQVARDIYGLQPIGTARILVEAKQKNLLPDIAAPFQKLRQEGYWIHASIVAAALREAGEI